MSFFKFQSIKKLIDVKKACKSFTDQIFRSRSNRIRVRKAIKTVTTFLVSSRHKIRIRSMKQRSTTSHHYHLLQKGLPAIYIDELYVPKSGQSSREQVTNTDNESNVATTSANIRSIKQEENVERRRDSLLREKKKDGSRKQDMLQTRDIRGVDERAEDYILKVREQMRLQREQSILDFQEMLARSV
ncbi:hypothetical protein L1887_32629 [Cichorium endivia]|nr:hypothetical protein L1887_32629 [Cichorium endivia]